MPSRNCLPTLGYTEIDTVSPEAKKKSTSKFRATRNCIVEASMHSSIRDPDNCATCCEDVGPARAHLCQGCSSCSSVTSTTQSHLCLGRHVVSLQAAAKVCKGALARPAGQRVGTGARVSLMPYRRLGRNAVNLQRTGGARAAPAPHCHCLLRSVKRLTNPVTGGGVRHIPRNSRSSSPALKTLGQWPDNAAAPTQARCHRSQGNATAQVRQQLQLVHSYAPSFLQDLLPLRGGRAGCAGIWPAKLGTRHHA